MSGADTLPGCFSLYPKALPPNNCSTCQFSEDCSKYVRKDALKPILAKILEAKQILRGEQS
jgi:putative component of membrane protein insertase Oxa1/YidC/SpoIIIJ protein YidD